MVGKKIVKKALFYEV